MKEWYIVETNNQIPRRNGVWLVQATGTSDAIDKLIKEHGVSPDYDEYVSYKLKFDQEIIPLRYF